MGLGSAIAKIGGFAAAPFTGGWSIPAGLAVGAGLDAGGKKSKSNGSDDDGSLSLDPYAQLLKNNAAGLNLQGNHLSTFGEETVAPAVQYFTNLLNNTPGSLDQATKAARGKVIDQYDTARQAIAKFAPRSGGQVSALAQSRVDQANQISDVTAATQAGAADKLSTLGTSITGLGLSAQSLANSSLESVIQAALAKQGLDVTRRGQDRALYGDLGQAAGNIIGTILLGGEGD